MKEFLTKKQFGLPMWAWGLIVALVLFVGIKYMRKKQAGGTANQSPLHLTELRQPMERKAE